jgi:hypothetical protein
VIKTNKGFFAFVSCIWLLMAAWMFQFSPPSSLPQNWVNNLEYLGRTTNVINFPGAWTCQGSGVSYGPYTAGNQASLQQAWNDALSCRVAAQQGTIINVPSLGLYSGPGLVWNMAQGDTDTSSTPFVIVTSTNPLPMGVTPCSHGIQDNDPGAKEPGLINWYCDGTDLSYQLGQTITTVPANSAYNDVAHMFTIECSTSNCNGVATGSWDTNPASPTYNVGPHHFAILNAEIRPQAGLTAPAAPIAFGIGTETIAGQLPSHMHAAYDYLHGDWSKAPTSGGVATGPPTGTNVLPNMIALNGCIYCSVMYNYINRALRPGAEGHGLALLMVQQFKLAHNWIEGESIGLLCGGQGYQIPVTGFLGCTDVEDRANRYTYPLSWMQAAAAGFKPGASYVRKNAHEIKVAFNYLMDGNYFQNVDDSGAQNGTIVSIKDDNNAAVGAVTNNWIQTTNVTFTNNVMANSCNGLSYGFRSQSTAGDGGGTALPVQNLLLQNNVLYNYGVTLVPGCAGVSPQFGYRAAVTGKAAIWNNATAVRATGGITTLTLPVLSPPPDLTVSSTAVGDPVSVYNCADSTFNTGNTQLGPPALSGTLVAGLTVVYQSTTLTAGSTTGCTYNNGQGWPDYVEMNHNSDFSTDLLGEDPSSSSNGGTNPYTFSRNVTIVNGIVIGGGFKATFGEGNRAESQAFDPATLIFNNTIMANRDTQVVCPGHTAPGPGGFAACYREYTSSHTVIVPATLYGTPTEWCTTNDPTAGNCVGIQAAMSTTAFPQIVLDYHTLALCHAGVAACNNLPSLYSAGQPFQATDGSDLGANITAIDAAQTSILYVCQSSCGTGPYQDTLTPPPPPAGTPVYILLAAVKAALGTLL